MRTNGNTVGAKHGGSDRSVDADGQEIERKNKREEERDDKREDKSGDESEDESGDERAGELKNEREGRDGDGCTRTSTNK